MNSIRARAERKKYQPYVKNILIENDDFMPTENILYGENLLGFDYFKISYEDILYVDKINSLFYHATKILK